MIIYFLIFFSKEKRACIYLASVQQRADSAAHPDTRTQARVHELFSAGATRERGKRAKPIFFAPMSHLTHQNKILIAVTDRHHIIINYHHRCLLSSLSLKFVFTIIINRCCYTVAGSRQKTASSTRRSPAGKDKQIEQWPYYVSLLDLVRQASKRFTRPPRE